MEVYILCWSSFFPLVAKRELNLNEHCTPSKQNEFSGHVSSRPRVLYRHGPRVTQPGHQTLCLAQIFTNVLRPVDSLSIKTSPLKNGLRNQMSLVHLDKKRGIDREISQYVRWKVSAIQAE